MNPTDQIAPVAAPETPPLATPEIPEAVLPAPDTVAEAVAQSVAAEPTVLTPPTAAMNELPPPFVPRVPVLLPIPVTLMVSGPTFPGGALKHLQRAQEKPITVKWHETVVDIFERLSVPTDGTVVMLRPGTTQPFMMWDEPYSHLVANSIVSVVPNGTEKENL